MCSLATLFLAAVVALAAFAPAAHAGHGFGSPTTLPAGDGPRSVAIGDFNLDNDPDLAIANEVSDDVTIWTGGAGESFSGPQNFLVGDGPSSIAVGDFNQDNDPDLAVANQFSGNLSTLRGDAGSTFSALRHFSIPPGGALSDVAVGHFNGDSDPDIALTRPAAHTVIVLLGTAPGDSFTGLATYSAGGATGEPQAVAVGNFNAEADSDPDLAVANGISGNFSILLGNPANGLFTAPTFFSTGGSPVAVGVGDFSGDGRQDLTLPNGSSHDVGVWQGGAGGSFSHLYTTESFGSITVPTSVAVDNFDAGTGGPVVDQAVTTDFEGFGRVSIFADGSFAGCCAQGSTTPTNFNVGTDPRDVATGDFDGNSDPDLAVANRGSDDVSVLFGQPPPDLAIDDVSIAEGDASFSFVEFRVTRSGDVSTRTEVQFRTRSGSAVSSGPERDYSFRSDFLDFGPGETEKRVSVAVLGDTRVEPDEDFFVDLDFPRHANITDGEGRAVIENDDTRELSINDVSKAEGDSGSTAFDFTVSLSRASPDPVEVTARLRAGTADPVICCPEQGDYHDFIFEDITFNPGETSKQVTVDVVGETEVEPNEDFFVDLSFPTPNATIADSEGRGLILDDDGPSPTISIDDVSRTEGHAGTTAFDFTVSLSQPSGYSPTVLADTQDGTATTADSDYNALTGQLITFSPGETSKQVTVNVNGDTLLEPNEDFFVNLSNPTNATIADGQGRGVIRNEDGYPRPRSASSVKVALVPAYQQCTAPNREHGPPLDHPSCAPPAQASSQLTVGTPDANGRGPNSTGFARFALVPDAPATPGDDSDVNVSFSLTDVRERSGLGDYAGDLTLTTEARITDRDGASTVIDLGLTIPAPCTTTPSTPPDPNPVGSRCSVTTTFNTLSPGLIAEGTRAVWQLEQIQVLDGNGNAFARQGIFAP